jgi:large repetitive protein
MRRYAVAAAVLVLAVSSAFARDLPTIDALAGKRVDPSAQTAVASRGRDLIKAGAPIHVEGRFGVPTFLWAAPAKAPAVRSSVAKPLGSPVEASARAYLAQYAPLYGLKAADASTASLIFTHDTGTGPLIAKFNQRVEGIEIFREEINVLMNRRNELVAIGGYITSPETRPAKAGQMSFVLDPRNAAANAYQNLTLLPFDASQLTPAGSRAGYDYYNLPASANQVEPVRMKKVYFHVPEGLEPGYYIEVAVRDEVASVDGDAFTTDYYAYVVSAVDGEILFRHNLTVNDEAKKVAEADAKPVTNVVNPYTYRVWADIGGVPFDTPAGNAVHPKINATPDAVQYTPFAATNDVTLSNFPFSMNDPWLDAGATVTAGNNVDAYVDLLTPNGLSGTDFRASVNSGTSFLHVHTPDTAVNTNEQQQGSIQQLFFDNNFLHDWYYDSGFNEAARNAQLLNFGRGGVQGDRILAEGQDFSGRNNANMATPADGASPRMQMFVFDTAAPRYFEVLSPPAIAGLQSTGTGQFGAQVFDLTAPTFQPNPVTGCTAASFADPQIPGGATGKIVLVDREPTSGAGSCSIGTKLNNAMAAGAAGFVLVNLSTTPDTLLTVTGSLPTFTIPFATVTWNGAAPIKAQLAMPTAVSGHMVRSAGTDRDGTIDNQVIFHEWGHYISNRLIGNGAGLANPMSGGMGEGWGDTNAMALTVREDDTATPSNATWNGVYALATYVTSGGPNMVANGNQGYYFGIRRLPYSTDMTKNPLTFHHISNGVPISGAPILFGASGSNNAEVHNTGEVWATMLWECYAGLLRDTQGGSPRLTFAQAQARWKNYLVASMKMTPIAPTFLEGRDAVLAVAYANDPLDYAVFRAAFAKRGAGVGAISPDRYSFDNVGVTESYTNGEEVVIDHFTLDDSVSSCDSDGVLDAGETGLLTIVLKNIGNSTLSDITGTVSASTSGFSVVGGGALSFPAVNPFATSTVTVQVHADGTVSGITQADFAFQYTEPALSGIPRSATPSFRTNTDVVVANTATDNVEAETTAWTTGFNATLANLSFAPFHRVAPASPLQHVWHAEDIGAASDEYLISPVMTVNGGGTINLQFDHSYQFEFDGGGNYDGGVVEMSTNGGAFADIGTAAYNGTILNYAGDVNPLKGRPGFVQNSAGTIHTSLTPTVAAGNTVQFRFRLGCDSAIGTPGWDIDNIAITGAVETPFSTLISETTLATPTPTITPGGPTTFCAGGSVTLTSSSATGNQWNLNGSPIGGATNQAYVATASGNYTVTVTGAGCGTPTSAIVTVTVNPTPATPTITPGGPTTFCAGGSVTLTSSSATGNQWYLNGNPIGGATNQAYVATASGDYTVIVTTTGCSSSASAITTVTVNPNPDATITAPASVASGSTGNIASVANAGVGATYVWGITGGTITGGAGTNSITFTAGAAGTLTLNVTVTSGSGCPDSDSANVTVTGAPAPNFDANGDHTIDPSDIFYLIAYLYTGGPAPAGSSGPIPSGDANGDGVVDPADIFYLVNYLFGGGPAPHVTHPGAPVTTSFSAPMSGSLTLGQAERRDGRWFVPVIVSMDRNSVIPQGLSLRVRTGTATDAVMHRGAGLEPIFETSRLADGSISYLVAFSDRAPFVLGASRSAVIAELEVSASSLTRLEIDPALTMLVAGDGRQKATVANHALRVRGTTIGRSEAAPRNQQLNEN